MGEKYEKNENKNINNRSIKKTLPHLTRLMTLLFLVLILPMNLYLQQSIQHNSQKESCIEIFGQLENLIENNEDSLAYAKADFKNRCINLADTAAYFVEKFPSIVNDAEEAKEFAEKLGVDEVHYFNEQGEIYGGSHPEYYGLSFDSGKQMGFFKPMLYDKSLKLCQDITPNTAESKKMQYAAVWTKDGKNIVQIGMEPKHLLEIMEEKNLQNTIKILPMEKSVSLHIIDRSSGKIISTTSKKSELFGKRSEKLIRENDDKSGAINAYHITYKNNRYCVYTKYYKDYILVRTNLSKDFSRGMMESTMLVLLYVAMVSIGVVGIIKWYIDKKLIKNLTTIIENLKMVEEGEIENIDINTEISEFDELLSYINHMLDNIRSNWDKISYIMDENSIPIGIFERNKFYKKIFINKYLLDILDISGVEELSSQELADVVEKKINEAESNIIDTDENIFELYTNEKKSYIRIDKYVDKQSIIYYITDISSWWSEINDLKEKSELDILTGLYNRRGFDEKVKQIFESPNKLGYAMIMMVDADNLKKINDISGHDVGDEYIIRIAEILDDIDLKHVSSRFGGDEYAIFVYGANSIEELEKALAKIKGRCGEKFIHGKNTPIGSIHYSIGVAYYPVDDVSIESLIKIADQNMYIEKKKKKGIL